MPVERHRAARADACMKFHFGLHRTSRENFGGGLALRCDSTDIRKEIEEEEEFVIYLSLGFHIIYPFGFLQSEFSHVWPWPGRGSRCTACTACIILFALGIRIRGPNSFRKFPFGTHRSQRALQFSQLEISHSIVHFVHSEPHDEHVVVEFVSGIPYIFLYSGYTLRSPIEAPLITREVLPETYFLLVIMAADAQAGPFLEFQASCWCGTL